MTGINDFSEMSVPPKAWEIGAFIGGGLLAALMVVLAALMLGEGDTLGKAIGFLLQNILWCLPLFGFAIFLRHRRISKQAMYDLLISELRAGLRDR